MQLPKRCLNALGCNMWRCLWCPSVCREREVSGSNPSWIIPISAFLWLVEEEDTMTWGGLNNYNVHGFVSHLQLIDSFAWELGTLKKEMGKKTKPVQEEPDKGAALGWAHFCFILRLAVWFFLSVTLMDLLILELHFNVLPFSIATGRGRYFHDLNVYLREVFAVIDVCTPCWVFLVEPGWCFWTGRKGGGKKSLSKVEEGWLLKLM